MAAKIIVSYDGTANEDDAIALGRILGRAGAQIALAYVAHTEDSAGDTQGILNRGLQLLGDPSATGHVVTDRSTPAGLAALAEAEQADVVVFCSDSHTAKGHVSIGNSAQRLLERGRTAIAIAPAGLADSQRPINTVVAVGEARGDDSADSSAHALAEALGATLAPVAGSGADLIVVGSRAGAPQGRIDLSSAATHLIENATAAVVVVPSGVTLPFGARTAAVA